MKKILVIDDEQTIRDTISLLLSARGFAVVTAADGLAGVKVARQEKPDLVISDIAMEPVVGFRFVEALHARGFKDKDRIPTIFLTGHTEREIVIKAKQLGADGFLVKPVSAKDLKARITFAMNRAD